MNKVHWPKDGSVVVIDDKINEAMPLIQLLSKNGISATYYNGKDDEIPNKPIQKIRLVFLDIQLFGPSDAHSYSQNLLRILDSLISVDNGPYIVIIWSTKEKINADTLEAELEAFVKKPIAILKLEKAKYFKKEQDDGLKDSLFENIDTNLTTRFTPDDLIAIKSVISKQFIGKNAIVPVDNALELIYTALQEKMKNLSSFHFFTIWENLINVASGKIVNNYSLQYQTDPNWDNNFKYCIYRMGQAQFGKHIDMTDENTIIHGALKTLNHTFIDEVENEIHKHKNINEHITLDKDNISYLKIFANVTYKIKWKSSTGKYQLYINDLLVPTNSKGEDNIEKLQKKGRTELEKGYIKQMIIEYDSIKPVINNRLLLDFNLSEQFKPGCVIEKIIDVPRKKELLLNYFKKDSAILNKEGEYLIDTNTLNKILFIEMEVTPVCDFAQNKWLKSRLLPGVLIPLNYKDAIEKRESFIYDIPQIKYNEIDYILIFDFRLLKSVEIDKNSKTKPIFKLRNEVFMHIQSKLSNHASRVGITYIE